MMPRSHTRLPTSDSPSFGEGPVGRRTDIPLTTPSHFRTLLRKSHGAERSKNALFLYACNNLARCVEMAATLDHYYSEFTSERGSKP